MSHKKETNANRKNEETKKCTVCKVKTRVSRLEECDEKSCDNLVCKECYVRCCKYGYCIECVEGGTLLDDENKFKRCEDCDKNLCPACTNDCTVCGLSFCKKHAHRCRSFVREDKTRVCAKICCTDHKKNCEKCGIEICKDHQYHCDICTDEEKKRTKSKKIARKNPKKILYCYACFAVHKHSVLSEKPKNDKKSSDSRVHTSSSKILPPPPRSRYEEYRHKEKIRRDRNSKN